MYISFKCFKHFARHYVMVAFISLALFAFVCVYVHACDGLQHDDILLMCQLYSFLLQKSFINGLAVIIKIRCFFFCFFGRAGLHFGLLKAALLILHENFAGYGSSYVNYIVILSELAKWNECRYSLSH